MVCREGFCGRITMKVEEILVGDVKYCAPGDSLNRAAQIMWEGDCGCIPVVEGDKVVGMITDRDICMAAYTRGLALGDLHVSNTMSRNVFACRSSDDILAAQQVMREHRVRRLPVTDAAGKLLGIISLTDIARAVAKTHNATGKAKVTDTLVAVCEPHRQQEKQESGEISVDHRSSPARGGRRAAAAQSGVVPGKQKR